MNKLLMVLLAGFSSVAFAASPDQTFFEKAAAGGMFEVETGKLAQSKGSARAVKDFGSMMVKDHSKANAELKSLAKSKGVNLPKEPDAKHKAIIEQLSSKSGKAFDQAYIQAMIKDHEDDIALFEQQSTSGQDAEARAFASKTLPHLKHHLSTVQSMRSQQSN